MRRVCKAKHVRLLWLPALVGVILCGGAVLLVENSPAEHKLPAKGLWNPNRRLAGTNTGSSTAWTRDAVRTQKSKTTVIGDRPPVELDSGPVVNLSMASLGDLSQQLDKGGPAEAAAPAPSKQKRGVSREDLVVSIPTSVKRLALVEASRSWRKGVRTKIVLEKDIAQDPEYKDYYASASKHNESLGEFWDLIVYDHIHHKEGDVRAAMAPFIANMTYGMENYKWILYGDDDTVFFIDNVLDLVKDLDHNMPYFISDAIWWPNWSPDGAPTYVHGNRWAPRCLPCNYTDPLAGKSHPFGFAAQPACPCTNEALCRMDNINAFNQDGCHWNGYRPGSWYFIHGGAGALISAGLMREATYAAAEEYVVHHDYGSGDSMITQVMWDLFKTLPTDPGFGFYRDHVQMFDPGWRGERVRGPEDAGTVDLGNDPAGILERYESAAKQRCNSKCIEQLDHVITSHLRSRYAKDDVEIGAVKAAMPQYKGPFDLLPAVFFHERLANATHKYVEGRSLRRSIADAPKKLVNKQLHNIAKTFGLQMEPKDSIEIN